MREICLYVKGETETHLFCDTDQCLSEEEYHKKMNQLASRNVAAFSVPCFTKIPPLNRLNEVVQDTTSMLMGSSTTSKGANQGDSCTLGMMETSDPIKCKDPMVCVSDFKDRDSGTCQNCSPMHSERNECLFTLPEAAIKHCANLHDIDPARVLEFDEYKMRKDAIHGDAEARKFYENLESVISDLDGDRKKIAQCVIQKESADSGCCENFVCNPHVSVSMLVDEDREHLPGTCERPKFMSSCQI